MFKRIIISTALLLIANLALAHGDHAPPPKVAECKDAKACTKQEVIAGSNKFLPNLLSSGKLDASWKGVSASEPEQKTFGSATEWIVPFKNSKASDKAKQTLYLFVTLDGILSGANFTGK